MDEELKRRLVGAAVIVLLAVVVVPLFFEDKSKLGQDPDALPAPMDEHALVLPQDTAAPAAETAAGSPGSGIEGTPLTVPVVPKNRRYDVVPLEDPPPKPAKVEPVLESLPADRAVPEAPEEMPIADEGPVTAPATDKAPRASLAGKTPPAKPKPAAKVTSAESVSPKPVGSAGSARSMAPAKTPPAKKAEARAAAKSAKTPAAPSAEVPKAVVAAKPAPPTARSTEPAAKKATPTTAKTGPKPGSKSPTPTAASAPKAAAGNSKTWTVQAGTFAEESNARSLAEKLNKRNLPAKVRVMEGANGKVYRVTVGPNLERSHAEKIQKQLATQDDVKGVIVQTR